VSVWDPRDVIATKRDGGTLAPAEVERFVGGFARNEIGDGPAAAFLMACLLNGLDEQETLAMTRSILGSGATIGLEAIDRPTVDKHSTGGVGDGVSLIFAPLAAALGLGVVKLSGRGLGHTGGTLDKLAAIPGLRTDLAVEELERQVLEVGCVIAAQSPAIVPADRALYALRDATATVPSVPLIASSVMAKKLAIGSDLILLDVKAGSGAFMASVADAMALGEACLAIAGHAGRRCEAAVTDMSQPLGHAVGNALDVGEAIAVLQGEEHGRLRDLALAFAARAVMAAERIPPDQAAHRAERSLEDGSALERFRAMVASQGGDGRVADDPAGILPRAPVVTPIRADRSGWLSGIRTDEIGRASGALGAGRVRPDDAIDPAVGIVLRPTIGERIEYGEPIGDVHARSHDDAGAAVRRTLAALTIVEGPVAAPPLVHAWLEGG
jgi:pyrimidine-nucleoside phosphorylase